MNSTGQPATHEQLNELHQLVTTGLSRALKTTPSAELIGVARAFLRDQGLLGLAVTPGQRKKLERLHDLLIARLLEAMEGPDRVSPALMGEVRQILRAHGIEKDTGAAEDQAAALAYLSSASLPFKAPTQ